jgi:hypothetical protein
MRGDDVWEEIAKIMGMEHADTNTPHWFDHHMAAMGNIITWMTSAELAQLDKEVVELSQIGYSDSQKRK